VHEQILSTQDSVPVEAPVSIELGSAPLNSDSMKQLATGSLVTLDRQVNDPVDVVVAGRLIARGELIVIEEEGSSLMLRLKQWDPGMAPRAEGFQVMELLEIGDNRVVFENVSDGGLQQLGYSLDGDQFTISVTTAQGAFDIPLTRRAAH